MTEFENVSQIVMQTDTFNTQQPKEAPALIPGFCVSLKVRVIQRLVYPNSFPSPIETNGAHLREKMDFTFFANNFLKGRRGLDGGFFAFEGEKDNYRVRFIQTR